MLARFTSALRGGEESAVNPVNEQECVREFRTRIEQEHLLTAEQQLWLDDECLLRYLRARKFNTDKAAALASATLRWREVNDVHKLLPARNSQKLTTLRSEGESGKMFVLPIVDKSGRAVIVMRPGLENSSDVTGNLLFLQYTLERASRLCNSVCGGTGKFVVIIDFAEGQFSLRRAPSLSTSKATLHMIQDHYPERLGKAVLFDAPSFFFPVFRALKPFIDSVTYAKIHFASRASAAVDPVCKVELDSSAIPREYGGAYEYNFNAETYFDGDAGHA